MITSDDSTLETTQNPSAGYPAGHLFIVCAPSGAGKSTLCNAMRRLFANLTYSVSYTTRSPRKGELEGSDYYFISVEAFERGIDEQRWAEWARVHGNYYGSSARWINDALLAGHHILMDIDLQGARQILQRFPRAITIFIMPPSLEALEKRLTLRGTDSRETIALRLDNASKEIAQRDICKHIVVNDDLNQATRQLSALIRRYLHARASSKEGDHG